MKLTGEQEGRFYEHFRFGVRPHCGCCQGGQTWRGDKGLYSELEFGSVQLQNAPGEDYPGPRKRVVYATCGKCGCVMMFSALALGFK